jgi:hypothetical protein
MDGVIGSHRKRQEWQGLSRSASGRFSEFGLITIWLDLADINVSADRRTELAVQRPGLKSLKRNCASPLLLRDDHRVDDVDHAIRRLDVSLHHFGVVDSHAISRIDRHLSALDSFRHRLLADEILRHHLSRHDVIGQDSNELLLVFGLEQIFHGFTAELGPSEGLDIVSLPFS